LSFSGALIGEERAVGTKAGLAMELQHVRPEILTPATLSTGQGLILLLSECTQRYDHIQEIMQKFGKRKEYKSAPLLIVVDDLDRRHLEKKEIAGARMIKLACVDAGAVVLEPANHAEAEELHDNPVEYAQKLCRSVEVAFAKAEREGASSTLPSEPDAYRRFAKAVHRLRPDTIRKMLER
jgi:hypothetical protein